MRTWRSVEPPACLGWPAGKSKLVVALAGKFRHEGNADALLARFGTISAMRGLRYWSVTDKAWRVLITHAAALGGRDFTPDEMKRGTELYFEEEDSRSSGPVRYRMRVREARPDRIVVETENASPVRGWLVTLFPAGSLRAVYFLQRLDGGTWGLYGLSSTGEEASALAGVSEASYINRAAALYRYFIGVPPDRDPPLAP